MRLLLITRNFPPLLGGMERLNWHLAEEMARHGQVSVIAPPGSAAHAPTGVCVVETGGGALWRFLPAALWRGIGQAMRDRPDVVMAGSGLTAPMAWLSARISGARAAVYLHGLDVVARHPVYRALWRPFQRHMDRVIANSGPTAELARQVGVPADRIEIIPPGVSLPATVSEQERVVARHDFRQRHDLGDGPLLLSVGRLTTRKGLLEFVRDVLPRIARAAPDVRLAVVGGEPDRALAAKAQTSEQILMAAQEAGQDGRVHMLGQVDDELLHLAYLAADVHIFPVRDIPGDPEGFGMVAVEAAAHGLPTVAYATGGVVDAVREGESGSLVPAGDADAFAAAVLDVLDRPFPPERVRTHAEQFAWPHFGERLSAALWGR